MDTSLTRPARRERQGRKNPAGGFGPSVREVQNQPGTTLGYRLWQVQHLWHRHIERELRRIDLTHLQFVLLTSTHFLALEGEIPSQIRLSNFTKVEKMMVSKNLRTLEGRGYMTRKPHPEDRRANRIQLTAAGMRVLQRAYAISVAAHAAFFGILGADRQRLNDLLRAVMDSHMDG